MIPNSFKSKNGHPRFPVFLRVRGDLTWEEVCANAKKNPTMSSKVCHYKRAILYELLFNLRLK